MGTTVRFRRRWVLLAVALAVATILWIPIPTETQAPKERNFTVTASAFEYSPAVINVSPGDHVTIDLVSTDVVHGLYLDGYDVAVSADPGKTTRLSFVADKPGAFRFRCSVTCGALHPFMMGTLRVGPNWLLWRAATLALVAAAAGMLVARK